MSPPPMVGSCQRGKFPSSREPNLPFVVSTRTDSWSDLGFAVEEYVDAGFLPGRVDRNQH